jgi:hypothetical protein
MQTPSVVTKIMTILRKKERLGEEGEDWNFSSTKLRTTETMLEEHEHVLYCMSLEKYCSLLVSRVTSLRS